MNQARETTNIYTNILDSTMETYASIINNNMSSVMKQMTSVSIILMLPTLIASIFGMNLVSGLEHSTWAFPLVCVFSALLPAGFTGFSGGKPGFSTAKSKNVGSLLGHKQKNGVICSLKQTFLIILPIKV